MGNEGKYVQVMLPLKLRELTYLVPPELCGDESISAREDNKSVNQDTLSCDEESEMTPRGALSCDDGKKTIVQETAVRQCRVAVGTWVYVTVAGHRYLGIISRVDVIPDFDVSKIIPVISIAPLNPVSSEEIVFWRAMATYYMCFPGEILRSVYSHAFARQAEVKSTYRIKAAHKPVFDAIPGLSESQDMARREIEALFSNGRTVLLNGVTGSGKTEIYMHLAAPVLKKGQSVLFLVPEIAISRQLSKRLEAVFGDMLLIFHSKETAPHRKAVFQKLSSGEGPFILLGTRSSLFLPLPDLGLVIVDEEHDSSYKQSDPSPRYNGRDGAVMLAAMRGANIVLGSATPSYEALYNVFTDRWSEVDLTEKFYRGSDPEVELIDMSVARRLHNTKGSFSMKMINRIEATLNSGEQVMVFRSRRAYATMVQCSECGTIPKCPRCNVSLSFHKAANALECHYCGYKTPFSQRCPSCGEYSMTPLGSGTEKIEEELKALFPDKVVARFDSETTESKVREKKMLEDFAAGKIDILVGTQMITKGFDFENLTLVAVICADALLAVQDFRADERAFQLLEQLRGRAGRRHKKGLMLIQTEQSGHEVYQRLRRYGIDADGGAQTFHQPITDIQREQPGCANNNQCRIRQTADIEARLAERKMFGYPPFVRLIVITVSDKSENILWNVCHRMSEAIRGCGIADVAGPITPQVARIDERHIRQFWIKLPRDRRLAVTKAELKVRCEDILGEFREHPDIAIDVDPY